MVSTPSSDRLNETGPRLEATRTACIDPLPLARGLAGGFSAH
jgi:hypothetical protein